MIPETIRAAYVIARRDFTAIIFSKAFFFFLLGPLFPLAIGVAAGGLGAQAARDADRSIIGVALSPEEAQRAQAQRAELAKQLGERSVPELQLIAPDKDKSPEAVLTAADAPLVALWSGSLANPVLTGAKGDINRWRGEVALIAEGALAKTAPVTVIEAPIRSTKSVQTRTRLATAQGGQIVLILLTMILAGMVLSNLVEEKTNKIIEILAAAIPMDAIFLGKLFAMLGMALVGITVWTTLGVIGASFAISGMPAPPPPAVGWPIFALLLLAYFAMAYLLLGSLFLGIGAMASTVREVQTLSMPVTMGQLLVFFLAAFSVSRLGEPIEWTAVIFPFSSPFAMIARAAQSDNLWQHGVALLWQALFVLLIIRFGAWLFRRNVMKSGPGRRRGIFAALRG